MKFLITGGTSYIGKSIKTYLIDNSHEVIEVGRTSEFEWALGQPLPKFESVDFLIHLAHDRTRSFTQNVQDVIELYSTYKGKSIFISTLSAHSESLSVYGRSKFAQERLVLQNEGVVLKLGLVTGDGAEGVLQLLLNIVRKFRLIPVPRFMKSTLRVTPIELLINEISHHIDQYSSGTYMVSLDQEYKLEEILEKFSQELGLKRSFLRLDTRILDHFLVRIGTSAVSPTIFDSYLSLLAGISSDELGRLNKCMRCHI